MWCWTDTGVDGTHPDLVPASRLMAAVPSTDPDPDGHGTHVAGTIAGGGNESATVTNAIPGSGVPSTSRSGGWRRRPGLFVQQVDLLSGPFMSDFYLQSNASFVLTGDGGNQPGMLSNGFINNLSWGYQSTVYDLSAASYDLAARNAQPGAPGEHSMLFVVAAGNGGPGARFDHLAGDGQERDHGGGD